MSATTHTGVDYKLVVIDKSTSQGISRSYAIAYNVADQVVAVFNQRYRKWRSVEHGDFSAISEIKAWLDSIAVSELEVDDD